MYNIKRAPFIWITQFHSADRVVSMPLKSFHRLADEIGDPTCHSVTLLGMTGRCGSTLTCQMMARVPNVQ